MALLNHAAMRNDPVLNHNFVVQLQDSSGYSLPIAGFSECSGIEMSMKVEEFNEGGRNGEVLKFRGRISWSNITLKKGLASGTELWDWYYSFIQCRGVRRDGVITLLNEHRDPTNIWHFRRGIPVKYTGPSLNATQNSIAIESIEIAHEGIFRD